MRPVPRRHLHAGRRDPVPLGVPAAARGERGRLFATWAGCTLIAPWTGDVPVDRLRLVRLAEDTFRARLADSWRDRRVFLLGDAAHLTPPFIGQGMGAGVRDAANLAWKLAGVLDGTLPERVLDTCQAERKPHARALIRLARLVGMAMTEGGEPGNLLRRLVAPRLYLLPGVPSSS